MQGLSLAAAGNILPFSHCGRCVRRNQVCKAPPPSHSAWGKALPWAGPSGLFTLVLSRQLHSPAIAIENSALKFVYSEISNSKGNITHLLGFLNWIEWDFTWYLDVMILLLFLNGYQGHRWVVSLMDWPDLADKNTEFLVKLNFR